MDLGDRRLSREEEAAAGSTDTCSGPVCSGLASSRAPQLSKPPHPANKDMHLAGAQNEAPPPGPAFPTTPLSAQACPRGNPLPPSPYTHTHRKCLLSGLSLTWLLDLLVAAQGWPRVWRHRALRSEL